MTWLRERLLREGPTDLVALMRIAIALLLWTRWGTELAYYARPHPESWLLGTVFFVASTAMLVGYWSRTSTLVTGVVLLVGWLYFVPVHGMRAEFEHHHTHILTVATVLLALTPCGGSWSVDRWLAVRAARAQGEADPPNIGPLWATDLIALQVSTTYFWSAWDKTQWAFLSGERIEHMLVRWYFFDYPTWLPGFHEACMAMAWVTVILEYVLPFALFVRRWQKGLFAIGFVLHAVFFVLLPVSTFTCTVMVLYMAYLRPEDIRRALAWCTDVVPASR